MEYECIDFEGLDQVGKGDAVRNISLEISNLGYDTCVNSFPYYATPIGFTIRDLLVNGIPESINIDRDREVELKMTMFALNRLEILNCILFDKKHDVYVFDRGPFSCSLTIGYHIFQHSEDYEKIGYLIDRDLYFDSYFRKILNVDNCVIYLKHKDIEWEKSRGKEDSDLHERSEVQGISGDVYSLFGEKIGEGWNDVVTKDENGWRSREDIKKECLSIAIGRGVLENSKKKEGKGELTYLGIDEVVRFLYTGSRINRSLVDDWKSAIQCNDKKEVFRVSKIVSDALASSTERIKWYDSNIVDSINNLISEYPEILDIINYKYGKTFLDKFVDSLK